MDDFNPNIFIRNAWVQTIVPNVFLEHRVHYQRERITLNDGDFLDLDFQKQEKPNTKVIVLVHGFEGSSKSSYVKSTAKVLFQQGFDTVSVNLRGCSEDDNLKPYAYHSGKTEDLKAVLEYLVQKYEILHLIGFSLGANICLKYLSDYRNHTHIYRCVVVSAPLDLHLSALKIIKNPLLNRMFLSSLIRKAKIKALSYPEIYRIEDIKQIKDIIQYDEKYTSILNGFDNALDYYHKVSSINHLKGIESPTLIINALDDPFLNNPSSIPQNAHIKMILTIHGGHVGYLMNDFSIFYHKKILQFLGE